LETTLDTQTPIASPHRTLAAIIAVAGLAELAYMLVNFSAMPVYFRDSLHYGESSLSLILATFLIFEGGMRGPFGVIGDRIGRKWMILAGPLVSTFTSLLLVVVPGHAWYLFVLLRILDGCGAGALWPATFAMIADVAPIERRAQAMSLFNVTYMGSVAVGPFLGGIANDLTGFFVRHLPKAQQARYDPLQASFYLASVIFLAAVIVALWRIPNIPPHHQRDGNAGLHDSGFSFPALIESLRRIPAILLTAFVCFMGIGLVMLIVKLFAKDELHVSETGYGSMLMVPALIIGAASVPLGTIGDRIGKARAFKLGLALCGFSMWGLVFSGSQAAMVFGGTLIGIGFVIAFPAWNAFVSDSCGPEQRGAVMGAVGTVQSAGAMIGAPIGGALYEKAHIHIAAMPWINAHYVPFIGCATLLMAAWLIAVFTIHEPHRSR
jgi:DHA1 family multidrug resistance protein-like MFS transporter